MPHVAARVLPFRPSYTGPVHESRSCERTDALTALAPTASIPPNLEAAYGIISGVVLGLLAWMGLLLPALYFLL